MQRIEKIVIIYNPKSTNGGKAFAHEFRDNVRTKLDIPVKLIATKYMRHAEEIARRIANEHSNYMIISASGDGGYHEVINGVLTSTNPNTLLGLLPAGNANDHYNSVHHGNIFTRIANLDTEHIDVLKMESDRGWVNYAHSYAGLGMTSQINDVLVKYDFHPLREISLVLKHAFRVRPVNVEIDGREYQLDNLIFFNSERMSKVVKNGQHSSLKDGKFEVVFMKSGAILQLLRYAARALTVGFDNALQYETYRFRCLHKIGMQVDGERIQLHKNEVITVTSSKRTLRVII